MRVALLVLLFACGKSRSSDESATKTEQPCTEGARTCNGDMVVMCEHGSPGRQVSTCRGGCKAGSCVETCGANDVELIYLVTTDRTLLAFDPRKLPADPFRVIKPIDCESRSTPFSMAVDRTGIAWVLYNSGNLYQVSLVDAHCFAQFAPPAGAPRTFGMGFVTDGPKATTEKLYVAADNDAHDFATIDTSVFPTRWRRIGKVAAKQTRNPELTGTADGRLYGYFPGEDNRGFVQELDRDGQAIGDRWELPKGEGRVAAWAFAFWGDVFYVFITLQNSNTEWNEVHAIHRKTGNHELVLKASSHRVVGAGVSTCAPLLEKL